MRINSLLKDFFPKIIGLGKYPVTTTPLVSRQPRMLKKFSLASSLACLLAGGCSDASKRLESQPTPSVQSIKKGASPEKLNPPRLASDVTIDEFFQLREDTKLMYIIVVFHAEWCKPCQVVKTPQYQQEIDALNRRHKDIRFVTLDIGNDVDVVIVKNVPACKLNFKGTPVIVPRVPSVLYLQNFGGEYYAEELPIDDRDVPSVLITNLEIETLGKSKLRLPAISIDEQ